MTRRFAKLLAAKSLRRFSLLLLAAGGCSGGSGPTGPKLDAGNLVIALPSGDATACVNTPSPSSTGTSGDDPLCDPNAVTVSYTKDIAPVLAGCWGEVCHAAWNYDSLVNQRSSTCCDRRFLVAPYHPSTSLLTQSLTGVDSCVGTMPQDGHLETPEIQAMIAWVCQGALNN